MAGGMEGPDDMYSLAARPHSQGTRASMVLASTVTHMEGGWPCRPRGHLPQVARRQTAAGWTWQVWLHGMQGPEVAKAAPACEDKRLLQRPPRHALQNIEAER